MKNVKENYEQKNLFKYILHDREGLLRKSKKENWKKMISIIMGIYNCADTLGDAIESIFLHKLIRIGELIMCDDGSSDKNI